MKLVNTRNTMLGLSLVAWLTACGGSDNNTSTVDTGTGGSSGGGAAATGGSSAKATGGATAAAGAKTGGAAATGGANATGGSSSKATGGTTSAATGGVAATGGSSTAGGASATGGSKAGGGTSAVGGSTTAGGTSTAGGATGTGGSSIANACVADTSTITKFCRPASSTVDITGSALTLNGIKFTPNGTSIDVSSAAAVTSGTTISVPSVFNDANCTGAGIDAEVANSNPAVPYTGMSITIQNKGSDPISITLLLDDRTTGGQFVERTFTFGPVPADNTAHTYSLTWSSVAHTDSCNLPGSSTFDQTHIVGLGFGIVLTGASTTLSLTLSNITFVTT